MRVWAARKTAQRLRHWDRKVTQSVFALAANSESIKRRIDKCYGHDAEVIHPPVDVDRFDPMQKRDDFYLVVSHLAPCKHVGLILDTLAKLDRPLMIIGHGPGANCVAEICAANSNM